MTKAFLVYLKPDMKSPIFKKNSFIEILRMGSPKICFYRWYAKSTLATIKITDEYLMISATLH